VSLATRCPSCGTIFRVVQDQLKVSEGWVRCGQCHEVFHGIEQLFDLDSDPTIAARRASRTTPTSGTGGRTSSGVPLDTGPDSVPGFAPTRTPPVTAMRRPAPAATPTPTSPVPMSRPAMPGAPSPMPPGPGRTFSPAPARVSAPVPFYANGPAPVPAAAAARVPSPSPVPSPVPVPAPAPARVSAPMPLSPSPSVTAPPPAPSAPVDVPVDFDFDVPGEVALEPSGDAFVVDDATAEDDVVIPEAVSEASPPVPPAVPPEAPREIPAEAVPPSSFRRRANAPAGAPVEPGSTLPSRLADDDGGPETLASMLPEPVGDWPPRKSGRSRKPAKPAKREPIPAPPVPSHEADTAPVIHPDEPATDEHRFLREARRSAFWNRPGMRAGLWVVFVLAALGAAAQVAFPLRDTIAARWPATAPAWDWVCEQAGCTLAAPRALASLALDGTTLTRTETDHVLLFSADLRNKAAWPVRMPAFDLKFTDLGGQVVARKIFTPADLGIGQDALTPDAELHVRARLHIDGVEVAGFQAEVFYP
jgi:predicted Zn finger-like uncharacterized protein